MSRLKRERRKGSQCLQRFARLGSMEGGQKGGDRGAIATTRSTVAEHWHPIGLVQHGKGDRDVFYCISKFNSIILVIL